MQIAGGDLGLPRAVGILYCCDLDVFHGDAQLVHARQLLVCRYRDLAGCLGAFRDAFAQ